MGHVWVPEPRFWPKYVEYVEISGPHLGEDDEQNETRVLSEALRRQAKQTCTQRNLVAPTSIEVGSMCSEVGIAVCSHTTASAQCRVSGTTLAKQLLGCMHDELLPLICGQGNMNAQLSTLWQRMLLLVATVLPRPDAHGHEPKGWPQSVL